MRTNNKYLIETPDGFKEFDGIIKSIQNTGLKFLFEDRTSIEVTRGHLFKHLNDYKKAEDFNEGDILQNKKIIKILEIEGDFYDFLEVEGHEYICNDLIHHNCNVLVIDECAYLDSKNWWSFTESILPSQAGLAFKKNIILSTPKGKNHFYDIWKDAGETLETSKNGYVRCEVDWKKVPRFKSDGTLYDNDEFMKEQIKRSGLVFFNSAYKCEFIGSSMTLIAGEILSKYKIKEPVDIDSFKENKILIYEEPIKEHRYVMGVDTAKSEGLSADFTGIQVFDMTDLNFKQVLSAHLKIDYALLPEIINEYGLKYNQALVIIENNEGSGQVVNDILKRDYEYENLYYEVKNGKRLKYPGFRTTKLSRDIILQTVKMLAESNKLELCDELTIKEFETFIQNDNGKFQAQFGCNDDLVMSVCLCFSIFCQCKNFEDFKEIVESLKTGDSISNNYLSFGSFEDGVNDDLNQNEFFGLDLGRYN